jgi:hypothetical protein
MTRILLLVLFTLYAAAAVMLGVLIQQEITLTSILKRCHFANRKSFAKTIITGAAVDY